MNSDTQWLVDVAEQEQDVLECGKRDAQVSDKNLASQTFTTTFTSGGRWRKGNHWRTILTT